MRYALGIDGGGSKCDAALVDETGAVVGWGRGGPVHVYYDPPEVITRSFTQAVTDALRGVHADEIWVAGHMRKGEPQEALAKAAIAVHYTEANEIDTAYASVQESWGLVVLSGTGSFVHGRTPEGKDLHFGGSGPVLNDYGSGYEIGLRGLRAAFASKWTEARRTSLAQAVPVALGVSDLHAVFRLVYVENAMGRRQIASLAKVVNDEAEKGDRVAADCVRRAADELANLATDIIDELRMRDLAIPVIPIGGVAQRSRIWWERMRERISAVAPQMRPLVPRVQPAVGAALIALRCMGVAWTPELVDRLAETEKQVRPHAG